ncbi:MAG: hypothetical protein H0U13_01855, partial [Gemmatimonadaceae bacterium]|nr:hypothetical protein [Gemmatimonadaceae bacterium]
MTQSLPLTFSVWTAGMAARWKLMLKVIGGTLFVAASIVLLLPPVYRARASFVTAGTQDAIIASALTAGTGLSALTLGADGIPAGEPVSPPALYVKLIESEQLRRRLLASKFLDPRGDQRNDSASLLEIMRIRNDDPKRAEEIALEKLSSAIASNVNGESNLVELQVTSQWPELAAAIT